MKERSDLGGTELSLWFRRIHEWKWDDPVSDVSFGNEILISLMRTKVIHNNRANK